MGTKTITIKFDDLNESKEADGTHTFSLDGVRYEIDLSDANRHRLYRALGPFINAGRRIGGHGPDQGKPVGAPQPRARAAKSWMNADERARLDAWLAKNSLPELGNRVPAAVRDAFREFEADGDQSRLVHVTSTNGVPVVVE